MDAKYKKMKFVISIKCGKRSNKKAEFLYIICYQLKIDCYKMFYVSPPKNHKENNYGRYRKENEKRIKACHYKKINKTHKTAIKEKRDKKATRQIEINKGAIGSPSLSVIT